jgi:pimeloyl-ACP methyl ester carboxylesterase
LVVSVLAAGCGGPTARRAYLIVAIEDRFERIAAQRPPEGPVADQLDRVRLDHAADLDIDSLLDQLEAHNEAQPEVERTLALAELHLRAGLTAPPWNRAQALGHFRAAASYGALALDDPALPPLDPRQAGRAVALQNRALERLLRTLDADDFQPSPAGPSDWESAGIRLASPSPLFDPDRIRGLVPAADYRVLGMQAWYGNDGLGVPLLVKRVIPIDEPKRRDERYLPRQTWCPATAVAQPEGSLAGGTWRDAPLAVELIDPFEAQAVRRGAAVYRLASDRTTPLAVHSGNADLKKIIRTGLLTGQFLGNRLETGIVMLQPYQPGKIPVLLIHGLNDGYATWFQVLNHLRNDPELSARYQFWLYFYPTGNPVIVSAGVLRQAIRQARTHYDPDCADPAWDQMVLVGHSMGGLLARLMIQGSGSVLEQAAFTRPLEQIRAGPRLRAFLNQTLRFEPVPEVRRVVFIATPHRGSHVASQLLGRLASLLVGTTAPIAQAAHQIRAENGPDVFQPSFRLRHLTSIANLRFDSPSLQLLEHLPFNPRVPCHTICFMLATRPVPIPTDGVVPYESAHIDAVESELVLPGHHLDHQKPRVTAELKRILRLHGMRAPLPSPQRY